MRVVIQQGGREGVGKSRSVASLSCIWTQLLQGHPRLIRNPKLVPSLCHQLRPLNISLLGVQAFQPSAFRLIHAKVLWENRNQNWGQGKETSGAFLSSCLRFQDCAPSSQLLVSGTRLLHPRPTKLVCSIFGTICFGFE